MARILGSDEQKVVESAYALTNTESALMSLDDRFTPPDKNDYDPTYAKILTHYMSNRCFLPDRYILKNAHKLKMPTWLIQGRYDFVCPPVTAYELHNKMPNSQLIWTTAGHGNDRPNYDVNRTILLQMTQAKNE
jgi:proline iminopeptidase